MVESTSSQSIVRETISLFFKYMDTVDETCIYRYSLNIWMQLMKLVYISFFFKYMDAVD